MITSGFPSFEFVAQRRDDEKTFHEGCHDCTAFFHDTTDEDTPVITSNPHS